MGSIYQRHELEGFLGEPEDFDIDAIEEEVTEVDYTTGNRVWKELGTDEINDIAERHRLD